MPFPRPLINKRDLRTESIQRDSKEPNSLWKEFASIDTGHIRTVCALKPMTCSRLEQALWDYCKEGMERQDGAPILWTPYYSLHRIGQQAANQWNISSLFIHESFILNSRFWFIQPAALFYTGTPSVSFWFLFDKAKQRLSLQMSKAPTRFCTAKS